MLPAGSLEAFASNRKLREQLEEVRSSVANAKAQVDAADNPMAQVDIGCLLLYHWPKGRAIAYPDCYIDLHNELPAASSQAGGPCWLMRMPGRS